MAKMRSMLAGMVVAFTILACGRAEPLEYSKADQVSIIVSATLTAFPTKSIAQSVSPEPFAAETDLPNIDTPSRLAYTDDGNVWLIEGDEPAVQLTFDGGADRVVLSSDKSKIVFIRKPAEENHSELRSINVDGSADRLLLSVDELNGLYPMEAGMAGIEISLLAFVYGTHDLLFNTFILFEGPGLIKNDDLLRIDSDSGKLTTILSIGEGGDFAISPNGIQVAVVQPDRIGLINSDGNNHHPDLLAYSPVMTYSEFRYYAQPVWAADSNALGVAIPSADPLAEDVSGSLWLIPLNGDRAINVGSIDGDFYFTQVFTAPGLSPALDRVVFLRNRLEDRQELHIANLDGSDDNLYLEDVIINWQGWSPLGSRFTFSLSEPLNVILGEEGEEPHALPMGMNLQWVSETEYYYLSGSRGDWEIRKGEVGGRSIPIVSPRGDFISFDVIP